MNTVYIGYDPKEDTAYEVLKFTIERIANDVKYILNKHGLLVHASFLFKVLTLK